jgi:hypothetical protein
MPEGSGLEIESEPTSRPEGHSGDVDLGAAITSIGSSPRRRPVVLAGWITAVWQRRWAGCLALECSLDDGTGAVTLVFLGRRQLAGMEVGRRLVAEGTMGHHRGRLLMLNPLVTLFEAEFSESPAARIVRAADSAGGGGIPGALLRSGAGRRSRQALVAHHNPMSLPARRADP